MKFYDIIMFILMGIGLISSGYEVYSLFFKDPWMKKGDYVIAVIDSIIVVVLFVYMVLSLSGTIE